MSFMGMAFLYTLTLQGCAVWHWCQVTRRYYTRRTSDLHMCMLFLGMTQHMYTVRSMTKQQLHSSSTGALACTHELGCNVLALCSASFLFALHLYSIACSFLFLACGFSFRSFLLTAIQGRPPDIIPKRIWPCFLKLPCAANHLKPRIGS
jgi:hypothetical protein